MTNDAKLGLLAGVAGVVAAAVFARPPAGVGAPTPAPAPAAVVRAPVAGGPTAEGGPAAAARGRPEVAAVSVSRPADDDD